MLHSHAPRTAQVSGYCSPWSLWVWKAQEDDQQFSKRKGQEAFSDACWSNLRTLKTLKFSKHFNESSKCLTADDTLPRWCCSYCGYSFWTKLLKQSLNTLFLFLSPLHCPRHWMLVLSSQEEQTWFPFHVSHSEVLILSGVCGKQLWSS